jgi:hypothetical protein
MCSDLVHSCCITIVYLVVESFIRGTIVPTLELEGATPIEDIVEDYACKGIVPSANRTGLLSRQEDAEPVFEAAKGLFNNHLRRRVDEVEELVLRGCNGWIWDKDTNLTRITSITN